MYTYLKYNNVRDIFSYWFNQIAISILLLGEYEFFALISGEI